ncbi:hypothetical protein EI555_005182 [Monodon monoceros]|uniref:Gamma-secretase subunit PEN-2 n=1 Tax=Monodon monoceros TaxID=40151 RepID=A0A4U1F8R2_MONMO|nr:hypothetical protein EI555_005182 [Monodon monoceros]
MRAALPDQKDYKVQRHLRHLAQKSVVQSGKGVQTRGSKTPLGQGLGLALKTLGRPGPSATMNLERVSNEEKLNLCRKYYLGGFAFLPFLWLVNIFWFFREAFLVPAYTEQSQIKGCESRAQMKGGHRVCLALSCGLPLLGDCTHHLDHYLPDLPATLGRPWGLPLLHHTPGYPLTTSAQA